METIIRGAWAGHLDRGLAPRELECTLAAARGMTAKEIARFLGVSRVAVSKRLTSAMSKLKVNRQAALVAEAVRRQIISPLCIALIALIAMHSTVGDMRLPPRPQGPRASHRYV